MSGDTVVPVQAGGDPQQQAVGGNPIQVSSSKKPLFFYVNLAKKYMQQHGDVELSLLRLAISTVVSIAEILKNNGLAVEKKIRTSTVEIHDEAKSRPVQNSKNHVCILRLCWEGRISFPEPSREFGYIVLTTSASIMDHEEARRKNVGGRWQVSRAEQPHRPPGTGCFEWFYASEEDYELLPVTK